MSLLITRLTPLEVKVGWEGRLAIAGSEFGKPGFVSIDGVELKVESWSATQIIIGVTSTVTGRAGTKRLVVHDQDGSFDETTWSVVA